MKLFWCMLVGFCLSGPSPGVHSVAFAKENTTVTPAQTDAMKACDRKYKACGDRCRANYATAVERNRCDERTCFHQYKQCVKAI